MFLKLDINTCDAVLFLLIKDIMKKNIYITLQLFYTSNCDISNLENERKK